MVGWGSVQEGAGPPENMELQCLGHFIIDKIAHYAILHRALNPPNPSRHLSHPGGVTEGSEQEVPLPVPVPSLVIHFKSCSILK